jgi:putative membrane protein
MMGMLANLPLFLAYFGACVVLVAAFLALYTLITPTDDWALIRAGNTAAALVVGAALLGFCLPLAAAVMQSGDFGEMVIWAAVALVVQLACFAAMRLLRRDVSGAIAAGNMAEATLLAFASVALGVLNAACLS